MIYKRGTILLANLMTFLGGMLIMTSLTQSLITQISIKRSLKNIDLRLVYEMEVFEHFRHSDTVYQRNDGQNTVIAEKNDKNIRVSIVGNIRHTAEYAIIEDGSYKLKYTEE